MRRGNSLIGGRREVYGADRLKKGGWLGTTPERFPLADPVAGAPLPEGSVHHFLLPAKEWGAVAAEKEAKALAPEAAKALGAWRKAVTKSPTAKQTARLHRRAEARAALVELDALVAVWLGITADQLAAIFKSRYPQLYNYESATYFDANGRKIAGDFNTYGHGQTKQDYLDLLTHLESPADTPPPAGYQAPSTRRIGKPK